MDYMTRIMPKNKHMGSNISDAEPLQSQVPNPNTLLSMSGNNTRDAGSFNNGKSSNNSGSNVLALTTNLNGLDKGRTSSNNYGNSTTAAAHLTRLSTGSRLCNHSLANLSPQRSIIGRRVQSSSSSRISTSSTYNGTAAAEKNAATTPKKNNNRLSRKDLANSTSSRIWTIEDEVDSEGRHVNAALLSGKESSSSGGPGDDYNSEDEHYASHGRNNYLSSKRCSSTRNVNESKLYNNSISQNNLNGYNNCVNSTQSIENGPLSGTGSKSASVTPSHHYQKHRQQQYPQHVPATRTRSVKLNLNLNANDQNQNNTREFSTGRIASFKRETKTAQTLAAVVGGFIICWLPFFVVYVLAPFVPPDTFPEALIEFFVWLGWANSVINPFIYAFYSADFRSAFWRLTFRKCEGIVRAARSPDRLSPKRYEDTQAHSHLRRGNGQP